MWEGTPCYWNASGICGGVQDPRKESVKGTRTPDRNLWRGPGPQTEICIGDQDPRKEHGSCLKRWLLQILERQQWWFQDFPHGGANHQDRGPNLLFSPNVSQKLHEHERNWTKRRAHVPGAPSPRPNLDTPMAVKPLVPLDGSNNQIFPFHEVFQKIWQNVPLVLPTPSPLRGLVPPVENPGSATSQRVQVPIQKCHLAVPELMYYGGFGWTKLTLFSLL